MRSWSVSSVRQFHSCQLAWWFKRTGVQPEFKPLPLVEGIVLHSVLAHYLRGVQRGDVPTAQDGLDLIEAELFSQECSGEIRYGKQSRESVLLRMQTLFQHWLRVAVPAGEIVGVEAELRVQLPGIQLPLLGYVDVVTRDENGLHVIDFKVTASKPWKDRLLDPLELQKLALTRGWESASGETVSRWAWNHLVKTKVPQCVEYELPVEPTCRESDLGRLAAVVEPTLTLMRAVLDGWQAPTPTVGYSTMCQGCRFRRACSTWASNAPRLPARASSWPAA